MICSMTTSVIGIGKRPLSWVCHLPVSSCPIWVLILFFSRLYADEKIWDVVPMHNNQILAFQSFQATIPVELVAQWSAAVELWEKDSNTPNPFKVEKRYKEKCFQLLPHDDVASTVSNSEHLVWMKLMEEVEERE